MGFFDHLLRFDRELFRLINQVWTAPWLDAFFPIWTDLHHTWYFQGLILPAVFLNVFLRDRFRGVMILLTSFAAVGITDSIFSSYVKPFFSRSRPLFSQLPYDVIVRGVSHESFSFPSGHTVSIFCFAAFCGRFAPGWKGFLLFLAVLTGYSRIYCGVHFPSDVLAGAFLGACSGWLLGLIAQIFFGRSTKKGRA